MNTPGWGGKRAGAGRNVRPQTEGYREAHARKESALADLREHELRTKRAALLPAEVVAAEWARIAARIRARAREVPARVMAQSPHLDAHVRMVLEREIEAALEPLGG